MTMLPVIVATLAIFIAASLLGARLLSIGVRLGRRFGTTNVSLATPWRTAVVTAPVLVATLVCVAVISAATMDACHCSVHALHHPHLCLRHPAHALPLAGAAAWFVGAWALLILPRSAALARALVATNRWMRRVRQIRPRIVDGARVRLVDCPERSAFTIGARSPMIIFDRTLWRALTKQQRRAVVHHEVAHVARRDGVTLLALRVVATLFPSASTSRLIAWWSAAAEQRCDRHAASAMGDEVTVADALVAVARVRAASEGGTSPAEGTDELVTAMGVHSSASIEQRVLALLNGADHRPPSLRSDATLVSLVVLASALATWCLPGSTIHHGVETLAGLLAHHS